MVTCPWSLVVVVWEDAFDGENGWTDVRSYDPQPTYVVTVGWLWPGCLRGYVTVVNSYFPDEVDDPKTTGMPVHIPVGMVKEIKVLAQPSVDIEALADATGITYSDTPHS